VSALERAPDSEVVLVTAVGDAEGSRGAAAALACAAADADRATLLVDIGGRVPRPTLLASSAAHRLEERLVAHLPRARVAARGQVCHLAVLPAEPESFEVASAATTVARDGLVVLHLPPALVQPLLGVGMGARLTGAMLRADVATDRALLALVVRDLRSRGLTVGVLKRRLAWVAERRALFGALTPDAAGGLPRRLVRRLVSHQCYAELDDPGTDPTRVAQPERRDHAGVGSR
jgi:hypothetical protein